MVKTRYLVIGYSRSGTTVTQHLISGHPKASGFVGEIKPDPFFTKGIEVFTHGKAPRDKEQEYPALFDAMTLINSNEETIANGGKTACNSSIKAQKIVSTLQKYLKDVKVIIIRRNDLAAQYGSGMHGQKTGIMHSFNKGYDNNRKIHMLKPNKLRFISHARSVYAMYDALDELKETHDVLEVNYEDIISDLKTFSNNVFEFLNLPVVDPVWLKDKKVMPPPEDYIKNYRELTEISKKIRNGELPSHIIFLSKLINHLSWRFERLSGRYFSF